MGATSWCRWVAVCRGNVASALLRLTGSLHLLPTLGNHYAYDPVNADGEPYIKFLPPLYAENDKLLTSEELPKPFYSSDVFTDKLLEQLKRGEGDDRPFFASLNYTAPHWPLQCSKEARELYKGVYDDGPDALRQRRLDALFKLGLIPESTYKRPHPPTYPAGSSEWDTLSPDEKKYSSKLMEIYAGGWKIRVRYRRFCARELSHALHHPRHGHRDGS